MSDRRRKMLRDVPDEEVLIMVCCNDSIAAEDNLRQRKSDLAHDIGQLRWLTSEA